MRMGRRGKLWALYWLSSYVCQTTKEMLLVIIIVQLYYYIIQINYYIAIQKGKTFSEGLSICRRVIQDLRIGVQLGSADLACLELQFLPCTI